MHTEYQNSRSETESKFDMDYYKLGETTGKAWRLGHMGEPVWEAGIAARKDLHIMEGTHEAQSFYKGFDAGISAVDVQAQQVQQPVIYGARVDYDTVMDYGISEEGVTTSIDAIREMVNRGSVRIPGDITTDMVIGWLLSEMNSQQPQQHGSLSRDVHTFEERIAILESLLTRYQKLGTDMSFEAFEERHRLEQDVTAYFNPPVGED